MKSKDILFVIEIDISLYDEAEHCTLAIKMGDLLERASVPILSTHWKEKVALERELSIASSDSTHHLQEHIELQKNMEISILWDRCINIQGVFAGVGAR